jgi:hypothetical protein
MLAKKPTKRPAGGKLIGKARQAARKTNKARKTRRSRGNGPFALTIPAAGAMVGLSRSASYRAAKIGQIPTLEVNGGWIVPRLLWEEKLGIKPEMKIEQAA